jgi:two-component system, NarL family, sensor kinase
MRLRSAVVLLAVLPLVLAGAGVAWMVQQRARVLAETQLAAVEPVLLAARKAELQAKLNLGRSAIAHLVRDGFPHPEAQAQALAILARLEFGHDGFFFVYDFEGRNLLSPRQPQLQGQNLLQLRDRQGGFPIQRMLAQARAGGGYVEFEWPRPSTGQVEGKLAYVEPIAGWEWMMGTGTYVDEPEQARQRIAEATQAGIADTLTRIGAITLLVTLAVVASALVINVNEQRRADARLRAMARQIVMGQESERARVARELHDGVSQWLVSVKFGFESVLERARRAGADRALTQGLDDGVQRLREVLSEVRRISHDLRPALLDDLGLARALEHLGREWSTRSGVALAMQVPPDPPALPDAVATALFRVAQEALGNVEQHAAATQVQIVLRLADGVEGGVVLEVQDDGCGFDLSHTLSKPREGLGLTHMRERIETLGGRFELTSAMNGAARGTRLLAWLPQSALQEA